MADKQHNLTSSWADTIFEERDDVITPMITKSCIYLTSTVDTNDHNHRILKEYSTTSIDEIIQMDTNNMEDYDILKYQTLLAEQLKTYIKNCRSNLEFDASNVLKKLKWLSDSSMIFISKCKLIDKSKHKQKYHKQRSDLIPRNSYNFCERGANCKFKYNNMNNTCYSQHFIPHILKNDIDELINHISECVNPNISEILKSINTIYFVLSHMNNEMLIIRS